MSNYEKIIDNKELILIDKVFNDLFNNTGKKSYIEKKEVTEDICSICLEKLDFNEKKTFRCGHVFHDKCIKQWFKSSYSFKCPNCKQCII